METLQYALLSNLGWAFTLAGVAAIAGRLASVRRRPWISHVLWVLVLVKLVSPPIFNVDSTRLQNRERPVEPRSHVVNIPLIESQTEPIAGEPVPVEVEQQPVAPIQAPTPVKVGPTPVPIPVSRWVPDWRLVVGSFWLAGTLTWWLLLIVKVWRFRILLADAHPADPALAVRVEAVAERFALRRAPAIFLIPARVPPMLLALFGKPRLLLPLELWSKLDDSARETILVHELAHLKRRDHWVRRLEAIVLGLHWWNPVAWWACREVEKAEEQCCDALVIATLPDSQEWYAEALLATALFLSGTRSVRPLGASGIGRVGSLHERMTMILKRTDPRRNLKRSTSGRWTWIAGTFAVLALPGWGVGASLLPTIEERPRAVVDLVQKQEPGKESEPPPRKPTEPASSETPQDQKTGEVAKKEAPPDGSGTSTQGKGIHCTIVQPIVDTVSPYVDLVGRLKPSRSASVRSRLAGILTQVAAKPGAFVNQGDLLFEIDPADYETEFQKAQAKLDRAAAQLERANLEFQATKKLRDQKVVSGDELALKATSVTEAKSLHTEAGLDVNLAKRRLEQTKIKAPISGRIGTSNISEGDLVIADQMVLATIDQHDPMVVEFGVSTGVLARMRHNPEHPKETNERNFRIEPGFPIYIFTNRNKEPYVASKIDSVNTSIDTTNAQLLCRASIANPNGRWLAGESLMVRMFTAPAKKSILVPSDFVTNYGPRSDCYVLVVGKDNKAKLCWIEFDDRFGDMVRITKGLEESDWVTRNASDFGRFGDREFLVTPTKEVLPPLNTLRRIE